MPKRTTCTPEPADHEGHHESLLPSSCWTLMRYVHSMQQPTYAKTLHNQDMGCLHRYAGWYNMCLAFSSGRMHAKPHLHLLRGMSVSWYYLCWLRKASRWGNLVSKAKSGATKYCFIERIEQVQFWRAILKVLNSTICQATTETLQD